jgi:subtilisin family serine protease
LPPPVLTPEAAFRRGWMPLAPTGVLTFAAQHPTFDGRGVLIAILDSGIDPAIPGLGVTTTGDRKILDVRDFSGEGRIALTRLTPVADTVVIAGRRLAGFTHVRSMDADGPWYGGWIAELSLGDPDAADLNADGDVADTLLVVVTHASDGWVLFTDTNGDGSLRDDRAVHDYLVARETFGWAPAGAAPYVNIAVNLADQGGQPTLDLFFDTSAHGSHVAGIAAGHDLYGVKGFDGVAPGAQLLGLKIADNAQGGVSRTGSMIRALDYAIRFAESRRMPLVVNMSFGVGNEVEGQARIDHLIDSVLAAHPAVVFTVSAGNDGPGISTLGFPGSATRIISVGALFPGVFLTTDASDPAPGNSIADFSARGGEMAGPDLVAPGVAYSTVPLWNRGGEREGGTSMAAPHAAGLAARLVSAAHQGGKSPSAWTVRQALMVTARPIDGATFVDEGTGLPDLPSAWAWLRVRPDVPFVAVSTGGGTSAAFIEGGLDPGATSHPRFVLRREGGKGSTALRFRSSVAWLEAPAGATLGADSVVVEARLRAPALAKPGVYVGVLSGWGADTLAGPLVRLVTTVVVPHREVDVNLTQLPIAAGQWLRVPFVMDSARPFTVHVSSNAASPPLAYLHEPGGMPFRDTHARPAGDASQAAVYDVLGRDAMPGIYELVVQASPFEGARVTIRILQSPVRLALVGSAAGLDASVTNLTHDGVRSDLGAALVGAGRVEAVRSAGSGRRDLSLEVPAWARGIQVDVQMPRGEWGRYTDFGVSLFDSVGRQAAKAPLNYAFGRLEHELDPGHGAQRMTLSFFPGFALPDDTAPWALEASIRFYADSAQALSPNDERAVTLGPDESRTIRFSPTGSMRATPAGYVPIGLLLARTGEDEIWATEALLGSPSGAAAK